MMRACREPVVVRDAIAMRGARVATLVLLAFALSCSRATLSPIPEPERPPADNKLRVTGDFCTTDPDDLRFPVKVLFIMDTSTSMEATDPLATRVDAMISVIDRLSGVPGVEFGLIVFGLGANILTERCDDYVARINCTPGFTTDTNAALTAALGAGQAAGTTDYTIALQTAVSMIASDMATSDETDLQNSRYVLIFLSDGIPDADSTFGAEQVCPEIENWANNGVVDDRSLSGTLSVLINQFKELAKRYDVRELSLHGAFVAAQEVATEVKACGSNLIRAMTIEGEGTFRDFSSGEAINFLFVDFTSYKRVFSLKNLVVSNLTARPFSEALYADVKAKSDDPTLALGIIDSDGDGLTDELEALIGSSALIQDSDGDGFSDLLEFRLRGSGFDTLDPTDADCAADVDRFDTDGDGLRDCEERFAGTNPKRYDSDLDGFGDGVEFLYGSNPSADDGYLDVDFDGAENGTEIRWHSKPDTDDISYVSEHAYRYSVTEGLIDGARRCYAFDISNISLASTEGALPGIVDENGDPVAALGLAGGSMERGENRILLEASEVPFDAVNEPGISRLACVISRFSAEERIRIPANGVVRVPPEAFVDAREFDPLVHCVQP
jgi:uncharacterized protein YegL